MLPRQTPSRFTGDYEHIRRLGSGGMGTVYLAQHRLTQSFAAVKILYKKRAKDKETLHRFLQEARIVHELEHPNIVSVYEANAGLDGSAPFMAMEYVPGSNLRVRSGAPAEPTLVLSLAAQAAAAIAAVHRKNIVHRDIKPGNIMIRDGDEKLKLLDFGLARLMRTPDRATSSTIFATRRGTILGTVRYMSPEGARGLDSEFPSDVFSLGLVLYELSTGTHPFSADSEARMLEAIRSETPLRARLVNPRIPVAFESLLNAMLAKDPRSRPTAAQVADEIARCEEPYSTFPTGRTTPNKTTSNRPLFVGRTVERAAIAECLREAASGKGSLLCISGEAGFGKTSLVEDSIEATQQFRRARGRCTERLDIPGELQTKLLAAEAYLPFLEAIHSLLEDVDGDRVAHLLESRAPSWYATACGKPGKRIESPELLKREFLSFVRELSGPRPLVLFLDDLHWSDISTIDLLNYVAERIGDSRIAIIATYRASDLALSRHPFERVKSELLSRRYCREVSLGSLTPAEVEAYIAREYPQHDFPTEFAGVIHGATGGTPLFMAEILRFLRSRGDLAQEAGVWRLTESIAEVTRALPSTTAEVIERKINRLSERERSVLFCAAAQGMEFDSAVVQEVLARPVDEIEETLQDLDRYHRFVNLTGDRTFPNRTTTLSYSFVHVLYQGALFRQITPTRRMRLSGSIANVLQRLHGAEAQGIAGKLAFLYRAAGESQKAAEYFQLAAIAARRLAAHREAADLARLGLEMLDSVDAGTGGDKLELPLRMLLGASLMATRTYADAEVEKTWARAAALIGDRETEPEYFEIRLSQWATNIMKARLDTACSQAEDLIRFAESREGGKRDLLLSGACMAHGLTLTQMGRFSLSTSRFEEAIRCDARVAFAGPSLFPLHPGAASRAQLALNLWYLGQPDRAVVTGMEGIDVAADTRDSYTHAFALMYCAGVHQLRGEPELVLDLASKAMIIADKPEHRYAEVYRWSAIRRGWAVARLGNPDEGCKQMKEALAANGASGSRAARSHFLSLMAGVMMQFDRCDEAWAAVEETFAEIDATGSRFYLSEALRLKGELLLRRAGSYGRAAGELFREGLAVAREQSCRGFELRLLTSMVRHGDRTAEPELHLALNHFTEGLETQDLMEARSVLQFQSV